jgi:tripartite-type tricarboxylate transporter receptor subunit TctC
MNRRSFLAALALLAGALPASAQQSYPAKPVRIVVAVPAGGSIDLVARLVGQKLTEALGQTFLVDNRPGGAGIIGTDHVAKAAPDGYTLAMSPTAFIASHPSTFAKLPYDPQRDFAPVIKVVIQPAVLVVPPAAAYRNVSDLVAFAKANPGKLNYGSGGDGSPHHLSGVMFANVTHTKMVHVPYKGGAPAMQDLLASRVDLIFAPVPEALPHVRGGKLRALAVMSDKRSGVLPDVPTMQETGHSGLELDTWIGLLAPAGTPREVVTRLNESVQKALAGDLRERFAEVGLSAAGGSPDQLAATIREDMATYSRLVKASGMAIQ